jgi:uncharacterized protein YbjT (DUF2867 family)
MRGKAVYRLPAMEYAKPAHSDTRPTLLLAGATGLVGRACLDLLLRDDAPENLRVLARRPLHIESGDATKMQQCIVDFERLDANPEWFKVNSVICALGTTMRKAGSAAAFRRVDFDYPLTIAKLARAQGASHFLLVSAMGADAQSGNFYYRVKGELEEALLRLDYPALTIARPSLLLGQRDEWRWGEELGKRIGRLLPPRWQPVPAERVAAALVRAARSEEIGIRLLENAALRA